MAAGLKRWQGTPFDIVEATGPVTVPGHAVCWCLRACGWRTAKDARPGITA
jgi:hypothetical protein